MSLVLVLVHELIKVHHVCLKGAERRFHEVLGSSHGLTLSSIGDLIKLVAKAFHTLLRLAIVLLELVTHIFYIILHFVAHLWGFGVLGFWGFGGTKNGTLGARIKIPRPLLEIQTNPKTPN